MGLRIALEREIVRESNDTAYASVLMALLFHVFES